MKKSIPERIFQVANCLLMILLMVVCIYPVWYVLAASFSEPVQLISHVGPLVRPLGFTTEGYKLVFHNPNIWYGYANTLIYMVAGTIVNMLMTVLGAYVLSRKNLLLFKPLMVMVTLTMYFGGGLIPNYVLIEKLHMLDTIWAIIIPGAISTYNMIVMRTAFQTIPASLEESAKLDGANDFVILFQVVLPLSKATLAVILLYYAVGHWNSWFNAMIYLRDKTKFPLQLVLREVLILNQTESIMGSGSPSTMGSINTTLYRQLVQYCTIVVGTVPIFFVYPLLQKHFTKGVMIGSIKE